MRLLSLLFSVLLVSLFSLVSCSDDKNPVQQYGNSMVQSYKNAQNVKHKTDVQQAQRSIQEFHAANGRYPADLNEVSAISGTRLAGDNYDYDPATGTLKEKQ